MTTYKEICYKLGYVTHLLRECAGQFLNLFGNLLLIWFISKRLAPGDFGLFNFWITVSTILVYFYNCLHLLTLRYFSKCERNGDLEQFFSIQNVYLNLCHVSVVILGLAGTLILSSLGSSTNAMMCLITTVHSLFTGLNIHYTGFQLAAKLNWSILYARGSLPLARFLVILLSIALLGDNLASLFVSYALGTLGVVLYQHLACSSYALRITRSTEAGQVKNNLVQDLTKFRASIWLYFLSLTSMCFFGLIQNHGEKLILGLYLKPEMMGAFSILNLTGFSLMFFSLGFLTQSITPRIFAVTSDDRQECMRNSFKLLTCYSLVFVLITFISTAVSYFVSPAIFELTLREEYHRFAVWHPWMVLAGGMFAISQLLLLPAQIVERPQLQNNQRLITIIISLSMLAGSLVYLDFAGVLTTVVVSQGVCLLINTYFYVAILQKYQLKQLILPGRFIHKKAA